VNKHAKKSALPSNNMRVAQYSRRLKICRTGYKGGSDIIQQEAVEKSWIDDPAGGGQPSRAYRSSYHESPMAPRGADTHPSYSSPAGALKSPRSENLWNARGIPRFARCASRRPAKRQRCIDTECLAHGLTEPPPGKRGAIIGESDEALVEGGVRSV
jgi:hypothetical protein